MQAIGGGQAVWEPFGLTDGPGVPSEDDSVDRKKKRRPTHPKEVDRPTRWLPGVRGFTPAVLLPIAAAWTAPSAVGRPGAPASIPKQHGLAARFASASAASRPGRGSASHTARRDATSAWTRHATGLVYPWEVITRIAGRPKPLIASAASPEFSPRARHTGRGRD
jgi:hypothetical protein